MLSTTKSLTLSLFCTDDNEFKEFVVARWVTDGIARCVVGRVGSSNRELLQQLEGRIAQVVQVFSKSKAPNKKAYSKANGGICLAVLVDRYTPGDELINQHLSLMDSDSE